MAASSLTWIRGTHIPSLGELILLEVDPNLFSIQTPLNMSLTPSPAMFGIVMSANPAVGAWRLEFYPVGKLSQSASDLGTFAPSQEENDLVAMLPLPIQDGLGIPQPPTPVQFGRQLRFCRYPGASERSWVHVTPRPLVRDLDEETEFQRAEPRVVLPGGELMRVYRYADKLATNPSGFGLAEQVMDLDWNINHDDSDSDSDSDSDRDSEWESPEGVLETLQLNALSQKPPTVQSKIENWRIENPNQDVLPSALDDAGNCGNSS